MSVRACRRYGCRNVMCDSLSSFKRKLCDRCVAEFKDHCGPEERSTQEFLDLLKSFLLTEVGRLTVDDFINTWNMN